MMKTIKEIPTGTSPVIPVRVWLGYALPEYKKDKVSFNEKLGSIFMPATVQVMQPWGLSAYLPTAVPKNNDTDVPDEVALVFYENEEAYHEACTKSVNGRSYSLLHHSLFSLGANDPKPHSSSGFPEFFTGSLAAEEGRWSLFTQEVNWQEGETRLIITTLNSPVEGQEELELFLREIQNNPPEDLDGLIVARQGSCIVLWVHSANARVLASLVGQEFNVVYNGVATPKEIPLDGEVEFKGIEVTSGTFYNFQFKLRKTER